MNPKDRLIIITNIALHLQREYNTNGINMLLNGYGLRTDNVSIVNSKRVYVIDLLKSQNNDLIMRIAEDLEIEIPEQIKPIDKTSKLNQTRKIFISHSSKDLTIVEEVIEVLEAIGVQTDRIFCSSLPGYSIGLGKDFLETIKRELNNDVLVLFILSANFYESPICLCEMGASWVKTNEHVPILIPPFDYKDVQGVIPHSQGMKINDKLEINSLKEKVESFLSIKPKNLSAWERKRDKIINSIEALLKKAENVSLSSKVLSQNEKDLSISDDENKIIKENAKNEWPEDYEMQVHYINKQKDALKSLKSHNPTEISDTDFQLIKRKVKSEWPENYEMQFHNVKKQIAKLIELNGM